MSIVEYCDSGGFGRGFVRMIHKCVSVLLAMTIVVTASAADKPASTFATGNSNGDPSLVKPFIQKYCVACHDRVNREAGLALDELLQFDLDRHSDVWENVVRKLTSRQMPPREKP